MAVPKASVDQDDHPPLGQDDVRFAWEVPSMQAEAEAESMQNATDRDFCLVVYRFHQPHDVGAAFRGYVVHRLFS